MFPILLIFGPSGVGKSTLADWIVEELDFLHFNFDYWDGKGLNGSKIQIEWEGFILRDQPQSLRSAIVQHLNGKKGALLSFPSDYIPSVEQINRAESFDIKTIILHGSAENCLNAFLLREKEINRHLPAAHWHEHNDHLFADGPLTAGHRPYFLEAFNGKDRNSRNSLMENIGQRLAEKFGSSLRTPLQTLFFIFLGLEECGIMDLPL